jgi:hypothetical protein
MRMLATGGVQGGLPVRTLAETIELRPDRLRN